jgi:hypothetical protein
VLLGAGLPHLGGHVSERVDAHTGQQVDDGSSTDSGALRSVMDGFLRFAGGSDLFRRRSRPSQQHRVDVYNVMTREALLREPALLRSKLTYAPCGVAGTLASSGMINRSRT